MAKARIKLESSSKAEQILELQTHKDGTVFLTHAFKVPAAKFGVRTVKLTSAQARSVGKWLIKNTE